MFDYYDNPSEEVRRDEVKAWIEASEENRREARRIYSLILAADTGRMRRAADTEQALAHVKARMAKTRQRRVGWWQVAQRVAAVLFLPLLAFLLWQQSLLSDKDRMASVVEIRTQPGTTTRLTLPDSTVVYLNASSVLSYPTWFEEENRTVCLTGEAYFEVAKDPERRFVVRTPQESSIEVYGTCFNVEAYADAPYITTTLTEGKVEFHYQRGAERRCAALNPGEKLIYDVATHDVSLRKTSGLSESCWKDSLFIFDNTLLEEALHMLGKRFNVEFVVTNPELYDDRFTGTFSNQQLEQILKMFKISTGIGWRYVEDADSVSGKSRIEIF